MSLRRRSFCCNVRIYFQFTFLLRVAPLLLLLLVPVVVAVVVLVEGAVELGSPMAVTGATEELAVIVVIAVVDR